MKHQCVATKENVPIIEVASYAQKLMALPDAKPVGRPSIFAFVFSRVAGHERRKLIRDMWWQATKNPTVDVTYKFAVCGGKGNTINSFASVDLYNTSQFLEFHTQQATNVVGQDAASFVELDYDTQQTLLNELAMHKDVLYLDCDEGYGQGALTKKVLAGMQYYWSSKRSDYFMKIDDDTFISWSRYVPQLLNAGHHNVYMGIPIGEGVPCRREDFKWYEPYSTYTKELFPKGMSGGSGYTIGQNLVDLILNAHVGENNVLYNEDRAVGVWMDTIRQSGANVDYVGLTGIDGFWAWNWKRPTDNWDFWGSYPFVLHHGIEGETIACLAKADQAEDDNSVIKYCFKPEEGKSY